MQGNQTPDLGNLETLVLIIIAILLTALLLYVATRLIAGKADLNAGYAGRLIIVAIIIFVVFYGLGAVIGQLGALGAPFAPAITIMVFTAVIYIVKLLLLPAVTSGNYDMWQRSIWISLLTVILIIALNYIFGQLFSRTIIPIFG